LIIFGKHLVSGIVKVTTYKEVINQEDHVDYQYPQSAGQNARVAANGGNWLDDNVYNRLLRERIIFLAGEFRDEMANAICAQIFTSTHLADQ
jgi:ATP-dependent protease ClpP protease subunit